MREAPPRPFTVRNRSDQLRLSRMLETPVQDAAINYPINSTDPHGFSRRPEEDDDNLDGPSGSRPPGSGPLPAPTGRALERPLLPENANPPPVSTPTPTGRALVTEGDVETMPLQPEPPSPRTVRNRNRAPQHLKAKSGYSPRSPRTQRSALRTPRSLSLIHI